MADHVHDPQPWLDDWVQGPPLGPPSSWGRPGIAILFNLECAGCISRAIPWLRRAEPGLRDHAVVFAVHTAYGHRVLGRDAVVPNLERFARDFARLPFPVALDRTGEWAEGMGAQGTPHWFVWSADGAVERSVYGSQENALTRLGYVLEAWGAAADDPSG